MSSPKNHTSIRTPCPSPSPPTTTSTQPFTLLCALDLPGSDITRLSAPSLLTCIDLCASSHPNGTSGHRCEAVNFEAANNYCYLKSSVPAPVTQTWIVDSAVAIWPNITSDCEDISAEVQVSKGFTKYCGSDYVLHDTEAVHADSLLACVDLCAAVGVGCAGVSWDTGMRFGWMNCYFKSRVGVGGLVGGVEDVDVAFLGSRRGDDGVVSTGETATGILSTGSASGKTWVAGAIVGPLALLAIACLIGCIVIRRRRHRIATSRLETPGTQRRPELETATLTFEAPDTVKTSELETLNQGEPVVMELPAPLKCGARVHEALT